MTIEEIREFRKVAYDVAKSAERHFRQVEQERSDDALIERMSDAPPVRWYNQNTQAWSW